PRWAHWFHADTELMGVGVVQREPAVWVALAGSARILRYEQLYDRSATSPEGPLPQPRTSDLLRLPSFAQPWFSTAPTRDLAYEPLDQLPRSLRNSGRLEKLSMQILQRHRLPPRPVPGEDADQVLSKVKVLEGYLANNPTEFVYALSRSRLRHDLDPTEEFLLEPVTPDGKKAGWCQHYASALALLLRAQQIPARIVIGFRGGEWNPNWRTHEIRAYHAHAWVEAFIGPRGLDGRISQGRWLTFEPTPSTALSVLPIRQASWWRMLVDDLRFLWEIIMLDGATGQGFRSFATINNLLEKWHLADLESQELLLALGRAAGALALAVIAFIVWQRLRARRDARFQRSDTLVPTTEWERTLVQWLSRILPARPTHQSLLEYAQAAQNWLQAHGCPSSALCNLPVRMTEAYYRYRFAGIPPASSELADFRAQLSELARWLELVQKP
ncbi:MAG: transglutaminase family protein, partial [Gemmatales bacterium]|nr:transglutaminase family protein [Gemmatales bacterium]MDW8175988.1 transglutaminase family protein [Gemmatales bacterium]